MPGKRHSGSDLVDHEDLVGELPLVEKMSTAERLKHAKKRRQHQLKKFGQYEKQLDSELDKEQNKKTKKGQQNKKIKRAGHNKRVIFVNNIILLESAARNDIEEVKNLLKGKVSPDVTNEDGLTALHQCCIDDLEEMLRLLLEYGANVNAQDSELWTPLHAAATCGHVHLCKILIHHGAELLSVNADGNMPYDICEDEVTLDFIENEMAKRGVTQEQIDATRLSTEVQMLKELLVYAEEGGDLEFTGRVGETPLHIAAANGYLQVTEFLISRHAKVSVRDEDSWQPIHAAACWGHLPVLEVLVQHGADLDAKTKNGETPYDICEDIEIRERLMELKSEMAAKGQIKSRNLVRRRSTNTRSSVVSNSSASIYNSNTSLADKNPISASVRRVSSKDKGAIAHKEAMEEAGRLRESVSDKMGEEEMEQNGLSEEAPRRVEDIEVDVSDRTAPSSSSSTQPQQSLPLKPAAKPQPSKPEPKAEAPKPQQPPKQMPEQKPQPTNKPEAVVVTQKKTAPEKPSRGQTTAEDGVQAKPANREVQITKKDSKSGSTSPQTKHTSTTSNTQVTTKHQPQGISDKGKETPPQASKRQKESANKKNTSETVVNPAKTESAETDHSKKSQKKGAPKAPAAVTAAASVSRPADVNNPPQPQKQPPAKGKENIPRSGPAPAASNVSTELSKDSTDRVDKQSQPSPVSGSSTSRPQEGVKPPSENSPPHQEQHPLGSPPHGTLSDLKKQRALKLQEKLHESMRFKDSDTLNQEISNHNAKHTDPNPSSGHQSTVPTSHPQQQPSSQQQQQQFTNGHNGKVLQPAGNNNAYPVRSGESMKRYKFSDTTSVLGDSDTQTSCCVLQ